MLYRMLSSMPKALDVSESGAVAHLREARRKGKPSVGIHDGMEHDRTSCRAPGGPTRRHGANARLACGHVARPRSIEAPFGMAG
jgi:hypothetical protein